MLYLIKFESKYSESSSYSLAKMISGNEIKKIASKDIYHLFETHTESIIKAREDLVIELLEKRKIEAKNIYIKHKKIQIKEWPHNIKPYSVNKADRESEFILLGQINDQRFKLINNTEGVVYATEKQLKRLILFNRVANCSYEDGTEKSIDTCSIKIDPELIRQTKQKYEEFRAKTRLLGLDVAFEYTIENEDIKITKYTGTSAKVILPNFITTICKEAFMRAHLEEIILNAGLKHVGNGAFAFNRIKHADIPEAVEIVLQNAFIFNIPGVEHSVTYRKLNTNTLIIE